MKEKVCIFPLLFIMTTTTMELELLLVVVVVLLLDGDCWACFLMKT
jgi:hypothetical protein